MIFLIRPFLIVVFTLVILFSGSRAQATINSETDLVPTLAMKYRILANDYQTPTELIVSLFSKFEMIQNQESMETLIQNSDFLNHLQTLSLELRHFADQRPNESLKMESLEVLISIVTEKYGIKDQTNSSSIISMYKNYLASFRKSRFQEPFANPVSPVKISIKKNEVIKTIGTYGIWGFWFVSATWGLVKYSPQVSNFLYYPAIAMFIASGPFSITNQIWTQVFDRIEKKAALRHQSAVEYLKDAVRDLRTRWVQRKNRCGKFYR